METNSVIEKCNTKEYISHQTINGKFSRYDLIVKYMFVEEYFKQGKLDNFKYKLYSKIIATRDREAQPWKFIKLIKSFENVGFDDQYHLYMTRDYITGGGKHRIALCLWFNIPEFPVIFREHYRNKKRNYTEKKMIKYGFKKYMPDIEKNRKNIFNKLGIE
jgi:hypothetical protein